MSSKLGSKEIIESIKSYSVVELNELVRELEQEFGVSAANFSAPAAGGQAAEDDSAQEAANKDLHLVSAGTNKIGVIKLVRELTALGLMEAKKIVDGTPALVKADIPSTQFEELKSKFEAVGASIEFKAPK
ncbi:50S ribosomal protein L7/L12 [Candidatus Mycoplasma haematolamae str. Purdue]|uniref:Large ribosomal subunit protein bL12 n=1 Tax=Mycoplasma haematolamae (strain Purdue) TaxID=1212765 RepID=I7C5X1_MYCHA|nr:50S ribosomal protein L7/L12 [Candidatus Mycoplasma haematolamae]AFO51912.1 50S ribosomal protein L7/L12 [Candidatus Mycoplasma haematolamae str. Purdue]